MKVALEGLNNFHDKIQCGLWTRPGLYVNEPQWVRAYIMS